MDHSDTSLLSSMPTQTPPPETLGEAIDALQLLKAQRKALEDEAAELAARIKEAEERVIAHMDEQNITGGVGTLARVQIRSSVKPSVKDWDRFYQYIHTHEYYHLLERRPSVTGCREIFERDGQIPGVEPFTLRTLHTTSL